MSRTCAKCGAVLQRQQHRFCSRRCVMRHQRAQQTPAERSALGRRARAVQDREVLQRLLARVKLFASSEDARIVLAWRIGKKAAAQGRYKQRCRETDAA